MIRSATLTAALALALTLGPAQAFARETGDGFQPVETARDLHLACGQAYDGFVDLIYEPVERSLLIAQCYSIVTTTSELVRHGTVTLDGKRMWRCVDIPDEPGELSDTYVEWIRSHPAAAREPAVVAFMQAIEDTHPCPDDAGGDAGAGAGDKK